MVRSRRAVPLQTGPCRPPLTRLRPSLELEVTAPLMNDGLLQLVRLEAGVRVPASGGEVRAALPGARAEETDGECTLADASCSCMAHPGLGLIWVWEAALLDKSDGPSSHEAAA